MNMMSKYKIDTIESLINGSTFQDVNILQLNTLIGLFLQKEMHELGLLSDEEYKNTISTCWEQWASTTNKIAGGQ